MGQPIVDIPSRVISFFIRISVSDEILGSKAYAFNLILRQSGDIYVQGRSIFQTVFRDKPDYTARKPGGEAEVRVGFCVER